MENFYRPPAGEPRESQPTEQFWPAPGAPGPRQGPGDPGHGDARYGDPRYRPGWQQPGLQAHPARDRRKALHAAVGVTAAVLLAAGGVIAGVSLAGNPVPSAPAASTGSTAGSTGTGGGTGTTGGTAGTSQAALLDATLSAASLPDATVTTTASQAAMTPGAPGTGTAAGPAVRRCLRAAAAARTAQVTGHRRVARTARVATAARCGLLRRRIVRFFLLRGVDGQFTFRTRTGALKTVAYQRGVIQSVSSGSSIVVKAADGTTWTWDLVSSTVVRDRAGKTSQSSLAAGEPVWAGGPVISGARDARLIFVRPPGGTS